MDMGFFKSCFQPLELELHSAGALVASSLRPRLRMAQPSFFTQSFSSPRTATAVFSFGGLERYLCATSFTSLILTSRSFSRRLHFCQCQQESRMMNSHIHLSHLICDSMHELDHTLLINARWSINTLKYR